MCPGIHVTRLYPIYIRNIVWIQEVMPMSVPFLAYPPLWDQMLPDGDARLAHQSFPFRMPATLARRIDWQDESDPLRRQFLPTAVECRQVAAYQADPLQEAGIEVCPGMLHKYAGRVLLLLSDACAVHCRYCFRRHRSSHPAAPAGLDRWHPVLDAIARDATITEVIGSGGDPLMLSNGVLGAIFDRLSQIAHLRRLRLHTRIPLVWPERVDAGLVAWLRTLPLPMVLVLHVNHPVELADPRVVAALARLSGAGVLLLSQSVLLHGVNDRVEILGELYQRLVDLHVLPYYLHLLDPVAGAAHFAVALPDAVALHTRLQHTLPGYLVPRLAWDAPGHPCKRIYGDDFLGGA
jgi:EF-P beta-lysylation protein EpmB